MAGGHPLGEASDWVRRWTHLLAPRTAVLDIACGRGRHMRWFAEHGHPVVGVDHDPAALHDLADLAEADRAQLVMADIENGPWPFVDSGVPRQFGAVVVTNYLWRPLMPVIVGSVAPGGLLLYETFAHGNASVGKPSRPDFLLQPGELLAHVAPALRVIAYEDGFCEPPARFVQRIAAVRPQGNDTPAGTGAVKHPRYALPATQWHDPTG